MKTSKNVVVKMKSCKKLHLLDRCFWGGRSLVWRDTLAWLINSRQLPTMWDLSSIEHGKPARCVYREPENILYSVGGERRSFWGADLYSGIRPGKAGVFLLVFLSLPDLDYRSQAFGPHHPHERISWRQHEGGVYRQVGFLELPANHQEELNMSGSHET